MKRQLKKDVLIALMNNRSDLQIAQQDRWYRINAWLWSRANKSVCLNSACRAAADLASGGRPAGESERNHERNLL